MALFAPGAGFEKPQRQVPGTSEGYAVLGTAVTHTSCHGNESVCWSRGCGSRCSTGSRVVEHAVLKRALVLRRRLQGRYNKYCLGGCAWGAMRSYSKRRSSSALSMNMLQESEGGS